MESQPTGMGLVELLKEANNRKDVKLNDSSYRHRPQKNNKITTRPPKQANLTKHHKINRTNYTCTPCFFQITHKTTPFQYLN